MTIKELYKEIKYQTSLVNKRLNEYYESDKTSKILEKEIDELRRFTETSSKSPYIAMRLHQKNKQQLTAQLSALKQFQEWDVYTPTAKRESEIKARQAYKTFKRNHGSRMRFKTYKRAVNIIGSLSDAIINSFDSNQLMENIETAFREGYKVRDIYNALEQTMKALDGTGATQGEDYTDMFFELLSMM